VQQETNICKALHNTFSEAIRGEKIAKSQPEDISSALRYAMMLVGIRAANGPTQVEFDFIKIYLVKNFGRHTPDEIRLAFDLAVSNKLELGESGAKCYENFSCEYVGRIMSAYRVWAENEYKNLPATVKEPIALLGYDPPRIDWQVEWVEIVHEAKAGRIDKVIIMTPLYDWLVEHGYLSLTGPEKRTLYNSARSSLITELNEVKQTGKLSYEQDQKLSNLLAENWIKDESLKVSLQNRAKILAVKGLAGTIAARI
jgi:hypothetical protein